MKKIRVQPGSLRKNYVRSLQVYRFESLFELVLALFDFHQKGTRDLEDIQILLDDIGYSNLKEIPADEMEAIGYYVSLMLPDWQRDRDQERQTYLFLAAFQRQDIIAIIDDRVIKNINEEIELTDDSVIAFIDRSKLSDITFTTI